MSADVLDGVLSVLLNTGTWMATSSWRKESKAGWDRTEFDEMRGKSLIGSEVEMMGPELEMMGPELEVMVSEVGIGGRGRVL
jgi:hypothetical protein